MKNSLKHYGYYDVLTVGSKEFYIMQEKWYTEKEFMNKMFGEEFMKSSDKGALKRYRSDTLATIDELNQYLEGNVTKAGLVQSLEDMLMTLRLNK